MQKEPLSLKEVSPRDEAGRATCKHKHCPLCSAQSQPGARPVNTEGRELRAVCHHNVNPVNRPFVAVALDSVGYGGQIQTTKSISAEIRRCETSDK